MANSMQSAYMRSGKRNREEERLMDGSNEEVRDRGRLALYGQSLGLRNDWVTI